MIMTKGKIAKSMIVTSLSKTLDEEGRRKVTRPAAGQWLSGAVGGAQQSGELGLQDNSFR
jgi:hypothetical protein